VTPRLSGSVRLSRWSHRLSIVLESMSCRKKAPSASDAALVNNSGSIQMLRFFQRIVNFFR
jgi:hypothetical protein